MQFLTTVLFTLSFAATPLCTNAKEVCKAVEPSKFLGGWFEIGQSFIIRSTFQRGCGCVEARYKFKDANTIDVINTCVRDGQFNQVVGTARILSPGELRVSFPAGGFVGSIGNFFQNLNNGPNYQIRNVWLDSRGNYQRALVTGPPSKLLPDFLERPLQPIWILSRASSLTDAEIKETLDYARLAGFDPDASEWSKTDQVTCRSAVPRQ